MTGAPAAGSSLESANSLLSGIEDSSPRLECLSRLGEEFTVLKTCLKMLKAVQDDGVWTEEDEARWAAQTDPLRDRMTEICRVAISLRARASCELRAKALFLSDLIEGETDLAAQLAASLCRDLLTAGERLAAVAPDNTEPERAPFIHEGGASFATT